MNTPIAIQWRLRPACIVLGCALVATLVVWILTVSSSADHSPVTLAGNATAASACIARKLEQAPRLAVENRPGTPPAQVSIMSGTEKKTMRVVYEGNVRLNFVIAVTPTESGASSARLTTLPTYDPAALVDAIIRSCGGR